MIAYVSGKYSGKTDEQITENINVARKVGIELWESGITAFVPHLNTYHFERDCQCAYDRYIEGDLELLARMDCMVMCPYWEESKGACIEHTKAVEIGLPIYYYPDLPKKHPTEVKCPNQVKRFIEVIMTNYRVHLEKNADYSPANILGLGEIGVGVRLWDKTVRLLNLIGFNIDAKLINHTAPKNPKNESINDTYLDAANYAVIGLLVREGKWGN